MIYIYCPKQTVGIPELATLLGARRIRGKFDGMCFRDSSTVPVAGDTILCWGATLPKLEDILVINGADNPRRMSEAVDILIDYVSVSPVYRSLKNVVNLAYVFQCKDGYIDTSENKEEYKIHVFDGKIIRSGVKVPRPGLKLGKLEQWQKDPLTYAHPNYRSYANGWETNYEGFTSTKELRALAKTALLRTEFTFGVVNIIFDSARGLCVRDIDFSPALDPTSVKLYAKMITQFIESSGKSKEEPVAHTAVHRRAPAVADLLGAGIGGADHIPELFMRHRRAARPPRPAPAPLEAAVRAARDAMRPAPPPPNVVEPAQHPAWQWNVIADEPPQPHQHNIAFQHGIFHLDNNGNIVRMGADGADNNGNPNQDGGPF